MNCKLKNEKEINMRDILNTWQKIKRQILITPIHEVGFICIEKSYLIKAYFYYHDNPHKDSTSLTYIGIVLKAKEISVEQLRKSIQKLRDRFVQSVKDGYLIIGKDPSKKVPIKLGKITPFIQHTNEQHSNTIKFFFIDEFIQKLKRGDFEYSNMMTKEIQARQTWCNSLGNYQIEN